MARVKNQQLYDSSKVNLLEVGESLIRQGSYAQVGINHILKAAKIPKGSFYHYFSSKHEFAMSVANHYHQKQLLYARTVFSDPNLTPIQRLKGFFEGATDEMKKRQYSQGCLMCNLTTEMADEDIDAQAILFQQWKELGAEIAPQLNQDILSHLNLIHLTKQEAADWLLNAWSGALTRMKAHGNDEPLQLFMKTIFKQEN
ncbi:TetR family transcriptional regulator [Glaciecola sp. 1036]|uniref:TetR/AcrR family transcriptional regulator n=1 Tax=Alteromonadaceae TaxID=72275 RepID=UPI003D0352C4